MRSYVNTKRVKRSFLDHKKIKELDTHKLGQIGAFVLPVYIPNNSGKPTKYLISKFINGGDANCVLCKVSTIKTADSTTDKLAVQIMNLDRPFAIRQEIAGEEPKNLAFLYVHGDIRRVN